MTITFQHRLDIKDVLRYLKTDPERGLSSDEAKKRLIKYGLNTLEEKDVKPMWAKFLEQFKNGLIIILMVTAFISFFIPGHQIDALVILIVVLINASIGFFTEYKAEEALDKLKELSNPTCMVIRDGVEMEINSQELVPGDLLIIKKGMSVPADARIVVCNKLLADEAHLTGESMPVRKEAKNIRHEVPLAERVNMIYRGTIVTDGEGRAIVTSTGMSTELGQIAGMVSTENDEQTPLQKNLDKLGNKLGILAGGVAVLVFVVSLYKAPEDMLDALLTSVSIAVAVIPEGLPVVVAITLTFGMQALARKKAIMRRLGSVETLGAATVVCTDKTGTLTKNEMTVRVAVGAEGKSYKFTGTGYRPHGEIKTTDGRPAPEDKNLLAMSVFSALCTNATLVKIETDWAVVGDPTEGALLTAARKVGLSKDELHNTFPRLGEVVFDEERMRMSTVHYFRNRGDIIDPNKKTKIHVTELMNELGIKDGDMVLASKGAPTEILKRSKYIFDGKKVRKMTANDRSKLLKQNDLLAKKALRVLAVAYRKVPNDLERAVYDDAVDDKTVDDKYTQEKLEKELVFVGLYGMMDPPRPEVKEAIIKAKKAGIKIVMITGDQMETAKAIGKELGILEKNSKSMTGAELEKLSDEEYLQVVDDINIYARAAPHQKLRIVKALKAKGHVVGMTGDGVNDAPALSVADIGIAMGDSGTDVAKEASEMVLADDNFSTIINAVEEGRKIYNNIKKFVKYQISTNVGAIFLILGATILGYKVPLFPVQILWINLLMDGPPAVSLGFEPIHEDVMSRRPRKKNESVLTGPMIMSIILLGIIMAAGTLWLYSNSLQTYSLDKARTIAFTTFVFFQLVNVLNCRSETESIIKMRVFSNKWLITSVIILSLMQILIIYLPPMQVAFHTVGLSLMDWFFIISITLTIFVFDEFRKIYVREIRKESG